MQNARFSANLGIFWNSQKTSWNKIERFFNTFVLCISYRIGILTFSNWSFCREVLSKSSAFKAWLRLQIKRYIREMYSKNIWNNPRSILWNFEDILTIGQILTNSSTIEPNPCAHAKCSIFGKSRNLLKLSQKLHGIKSERFFNTFVLCISYRIGILTFSNSMFLQRGFFQMIRIQGLIAAAH